MKARPVKRYRQPAYPTRLEVLVEPELLERHLPCGWRAIPEMAGTATLLLHKHHNAAYPVLSLLEDGKNGGGRSN